MTTRAALYMRISDDQDGEQQATGRQREDCLAHAARKGWEVAEIFEDIDISAFRNVRRPGFEAMLTAIADGRIDVVLSWKMDRLSRRLKDLVRLDEVCEAAGATIATIVDGVDTSTAAGKFVSELLVSQAKMESANTSIRVKRSLAQHAAEGRPRLTNHRAFGYDRKMENIILVEAEAIREAVQRVLDGESLYAIARDWNGRGLRTSQGNNWTTGALKGFLRSPYPSGQREYGGVLTPGRWPAIISPGEHRRIRAILSARSTPGRPALSALAGLLKCGLCGSGMTHWARGGKDPRPRSYRCAAQPGARNCGRTVVRAAPVEAAVAEAVLIAMEGVDLQAAPEPSGGEVDAVVAAEADVAALAADYYLDKLISKEEFLLARAGLQGALDRARAELARVPAGRRLVMKVERAEWDALGIDARRAIASALLERVELHQAPKTGRVPFDPTRLTFVWRA
jgi:DNA invertase Pin-like site-specific DNA recombinase